MKETKKRGFPKTKDIALDRGSRGFSGGNQMMKSVRRTRFFLYQRELLFIRSYQILIASLGRVHIQYSLCFPSKIYPLVQIVLD